MLDIKTTDSIKDDVGSFVLLYGAPGSGKTTNAAFYEETYGKTLILDTESGLRSVSHMKIDYLECPNWQAFSEIFKQIHDPAFNALGYKCIVLDSITNLGTMLETDLNSKHKESKNGWEKWEDYRRSMVFILEWFKHSKYHVLVTALQTEANDPNGGKMYSPKLVLNSLREELMAHFDMAWNIQSFGDEGDDQNKVDRYIVTRDRHSRTGFYRAKTRAPFGNTALSQVEETGSVPELLERLRTDTKAKPKPKKKAAEKPKTESDVTDLAAEAEGPATQTSETETPAKEGE